MNNWLEYIKYRGKSLHPTTLIKISPCGRAREPPRWRVTHFGATPCNSEWPLPQKLHAHTRAMKIAKGCEKSHSFNASVWIKQNELTYRARKVWKRWNGTPLDASPKWCQKIHGESPNDVQNQCLCEQGWRTEQGLLASDTLIFHNTNNRNNTMFEYES